MCVCGGGKGGGKNKAREEAAVAYTWSVLVVLLSSTVPLTSREMWRSTERHLGGDSFTAHLVPLAHNPELTTFRQYV